MLFVTVCARKHGCGGHAHERKDNTTATSGTTTISSVNSTGASFDDGRLNNERLPSNDSAIDTRVELVNLTRVN